jgi:hypothetical protein
MLAIFVIGFIGAHIFCALCSLVLRLGDYIRSPLFAGLSLMLLVVMLVAFVAGFWLVAGAIFGAWA